MAYVDLTVGDVEGRNQQHVAYLDVPEKYIESVREFKDGNETYYAYIKLNSEGKDYYKGKIAGWCPNYFNYSLDVLNKKDLKKAKEKAFEKCENLRLQLAQAMKDLKFLNKISTSDLK